MAKYFNKEDRHWSPANVRGLGVEKLSLWNEGFDIESALFRMKKGMTIERHTHHHWVQVVVIEGEMQIESEKDGVVHVSEGGCYFLTPGVTHTEQSMQDSIVLVTQMHYHPDYPSQSAKPEVSVL